MTRFFVSLTTHVSMIYSRRITLPNPGDFHDMVHQTCFMIWYDIYLAAIGLTPGGSSTAHIYTQALHRIHVINAKIYNKRGHFYHILLNSEYVCNYKPIYE